MTLSSMLSLSLTYEQLIGFDTLNNDSMAIGYALALVGFSNECLADAGYAVSYLCLIHYLGVTLKK